MWFFSDALFGYLAGRSLAKKLQDLFFICTLFTWIAFVYVVASNFSTFKQIIAERPNVMAMVKLDQSINEILETALQKVGSDRLAVDRFHDSVSDVQGLHFIYASRSNEVVQSGVASAIAYRQNILLSIVNRWAHELVQDKCVATVVQQTDPFSEFYRQIGAKTDMKCPIFNINGVLVGFIIAEYTTRTASMVEIKQKEQLLRDVASKVGAILSIK